MPFRIWLLFLLMQLSCAAAAVPRLQLDSPTVSTLQAHSGQRVVLTGYFHYGFESSTLLPAKQKPEEFNFDQAVWVELADGQERRFIGLPFDGSIKVEGVLNAVPGQGYGHLGGFHAELKDARIEGVISRDLWIIVGIAGVMCLIVTRVWREWH